MSKGIVIIGAGFCGVNAAMAARECGFEGPITVIGEEHHWPYERPPLSKWNGTGPSEQPIFPQDAYQDQRITLRRGNKVVAIERAASQVALQSGERMAYSALLIATGASARQIDPKVWPSVKMRYLRNLSDAHSLSELVDAGASVLIIGGGFIGLELAASLTPRSARVHVVEAQDRILARAVAPEISELVHQLHEDRGVRIHTDTTITAVNGKMVTLSNGQGIKADHVVAGIGSVPNTDLAEAAGLEVLNGIVVDDTFATKDPKIFAAGDCCSSPIGSAGNIRLESWQVAGDQGRRAGQIIAGKPPEARVAPWFWSDQFDHTLQVVGLSDPNFTREIRNVGNGAILIFEQNTGNQITGVSGFGPGNSIARDVKLTQKIIERKIAVSRKDLADPDMSLKAILRS